MSAITKGQCLTEHISFQINATCEIKADNRSTRETRSWSVTVHISAQASVMTCDAMSSSCFGTESRALRSVGQSQQDKPSLLIDILEFADMHAHLVRASCWKQGTSIAADIGLDGASSEQPSPKIRTWHLCKYLWGWNLSECFTWRSGAVGCLSNGLLCVSSVFCCSEPSED